MSLRLSAGAGHLTGFLVEDAGQYEPLAGQKRTPKVRRFPAPQIIKRLAQPFRRSDVGGGAPFTRIVNGCGVSARGVNHEREREQLATHSMLRNEWSTRLPRDI